MIDIESIEDDQIEINRFECVFLLHKTDDDMFTVKLCFVLCSKPVFGQHTNNVKTKHSETKGTEAHIVHIQHYQNTIKMNASACCTIVVKNIFMLGNLMYFPYCLDILRFYFRPVSPNGESTYNHTYGGLFAKLFSIPCLHS